MEFGKNNGNSEITSNHMLLERVLDENSELVEIIVSNGHAERLKSILNHADQRFNVCAEAERLQEMSLLRQMLVSCAEQPLFDNESFADEMGPGDLASDYKHMPDEDPEDFAVAPFESSTDNVISLDAFRARRRS